MGKKGNEIHRIIYHEGKFNFSRDLKTRDQGKREETLAPLRYFGPCQIFTPTLTRLTS